MELILKVTKNTQIFLNTKSKKDRKKIGQFFTDSQTAQFMASVFSFSKKKIRVLDPGAGTGILSAAFIEVAKENGVEDIELLLVENNKDVLPILEQNIRIFQDCCRDIKLTTEILDENFITEQSIDFSMNTTTKYGQFDYIISNPPYLKISRQSPETLGMDSIISGAPNLYFLFMALSAHCLKDNLGEMVFIVPRSWTSGAYFKKFRKYIFSELTLTNIHLFNSRDKAFSIEKVLQETVIVKFVKGVTKQFKEIFISTSENNSFQDIQKLHVDYDIIVRGENKYVFLPTTTEEVELLKKLDNFQDTLPTLGMKLKTGVTVDFKNKERLKKESTEETIPLIYSSNIINGRVAFPTPKETYQYISPTKGMMQENKDYLLLKRFTSKEEERRLQPAIYLKDDISADYISTDNKLNFIENIDKTPLDREVIFGLFVIFSSNYYDKYYRILNGSTQVNATEVNDMPIPSEPILKQLGIECMEIENHSPIESDKLIEKVVLKYA
ncbi:Eco57I restriction-modification methylase domain-containing protein [Streptococcus suis]|uniref:Eco57I restriction-modification methylase domain-containing protein n=1 Tax=Streptococcus suis TaxID=1307 RepID=UPI000CF68A05|nr:Eco57I restriction-modification methylase domain-containing protein [Streptococcus suis]